MMRFDKSKVLVIDIILLFIGVAVAPSINFTVVKASDDTDLVEVTTQACGIKGFGNTTVKLTREQYQNLEQYLVDFRARLNQTTTREEAVPIFKEAVVELNKYGLLPKGMSVEQAQRLVIGVYQNQRLHKFFEKQNNENQYTVDSNFLCLIAGNTSYSHFESLSVVLSALIVDIIGIGSIYNFLEHLIESWGFEKLLILLDIFYSLCYIPMILLDYYCIFIYTFVGDYLQYSKVNLFTRINLGGWYIPQDAPKVYYPSIGWVHTFGLLGKKSWEGELRGILPLMGTYWTFGYDSYYCPGVVGFTGIKLYADPVTQFYLGFALWTDIDYF